MSNKPGGQPEWSPCTFQVFNHNINLMLVFVVQLVLNSTVKERISESAADEYHPQEGDGDYDGGQEVLQGSSLQPVLNRPLLAANGVDSSTDTLVPETDVEERRKRYCSALRQEQHLYRCHAHMQNKQQPQASAKQFPLHSVSTISTLGLNEGNNSTTLGQETEGRQSMMVSLIPKREWAAAHWLVGKY